MSLNFLPAVGLAVAMTFAGALPAVAVTAEATTDVNVRSCGSTSCRIVDVLRRGEHVEVDHCNDNAWCAVRKDGPDGFVHARYLAPGEGEDFDRADLRRRGDRFDRDIVIIEDDDDFFDDDHFFDDDVFFERRRFVRRYNPFFSACFGGRNARFCVYD
jgi:uncharacterized protein YraI